ncbi:MAG: PilW family protein [Candidatus Marithrix sp.]
MKKILGFSIVEIMVTLVISSILLGGVISIFDMSKKTYTIQSSLSELQDNARFVMNELIDELRVVGYTGCQDILVNTNPFLDNANPFGVIVNDDVIPGTGQNDYPPSDRLVFNIDKAIQQELILTPANEALFPSSTAITNTILLTAGSNVLSSNAGRVGIRDCIGVNYYQASGSSTITPSGSSTITLGATPERFYQPPIDFFMTRGSGAATDCVAGGVGNACSSTVLYEVRTDDNNELGLWKTVDHGNGASNPQLLVEGVQNIQIRYGIDNDQDGIPNIYINIPPAQVAIGQPIVSVRLTVLMRTAKKRGIECPFNKKFFLDDSLTCAVCENDGSYQPLEKNKKLEDGYCHRLFTTTIGVRNGVFPFN